MPFSTMPMRMEDIAEETLALPSDARALLAARLVESLCPSHPEGIPGKEAMTKPLESTNTLNPRQKLIQTLAELAKFNSDEDATDAFQQAFIDYASETPDNLDCLRKIAVESMAHPSISGKRIRGLTLRSGWLLSEVLWAAEGSAIPSQVREKCPGIEREEWEAVCRIITVVFLLLEGFYEDDT